MAWPSMGPLRHTTGSLSGRKKPMDTTFTPWCFRRNHLPVASLRRHGRQAHHEGYRRAVHVCVDQGDRVAARGERGRKVHGHGALAHSALAAGDGDGAGVRARPEERLNELISLPKPSGEGIALVAGHGVELHLDRPPVRNGGEGLLGVRAYLVAERASGSRQDDGRPDAFVIKDDISDHAEVDDVSLQLRVLHSRESAQQRLRGSGSPPPAIESAAAVCPWEAGAVGQGHRSRTHTLRRLARRGLNGRRLRVEFERGGRRWRFT